MKKLYLIFFSFSMLLSFLVAGNLKPVFAAAWDDPKFLTGVLILLNPPGDSNLKSHYAPSIVNLAVLAGSPTGGEALIKVDCENDGKFEINQSVSNYGPTKNPGIFEVEYGGGSYPVILNYDWYGYWSRVQAPQATCSYSSPGTYTIKMVAEKNGVKFESETSFTLEEMAVDMKVRSFYNDSIIGTVTKSDLGILTGKTPKAPANIDLGVAIYNHKWQWPLFTSSAALKIDCNNDGKVDAEKGYSTSTNVPIAGSEWNLWCDYYPKWPDDSGESCKTQIQLSMNWYPGVCRYDKPGIYTAKVRAELPRIGTGPFIKEGQVDIPVIPFQPGTVDFSTGSDSVYGEAPLKGVDLKVDVTGVTWANGVYTFDCGNGQTATYSISSTFPKDFIQDYSYNLKDFCNYTAPGEYTAKVNLKFNAFQFTAGVIQLANVLSPSTLFTKVSEASDHSSIAYVVNKELKVVVTGKVAEGEYVVTSPFNLRWDVDAASSCTVSRLNGIYSQIVNKLIGTIEGLSLAPGVYDYKLNCISKSGGITEKIIKLDVVGNGGVLFNCGDVFAYSGQNYKTVKIGNQCWFKENLNIGTKINGSASPANNGIIEKYCYYDPANGAFAAGDCATNGGLYQWDEMMGYSTTEDAQGICPSGWHIPRDSEWYALENYLKDGVNSCDGGRNGWDCNAAGTKLQSGGSSGFDGAIAGYRDINGSFYNWYKHGTFWSSTLSGSAAWSRWLRERSAVYRGAYDTRMGFSVRCLKN
jgi:uncharacterized protein (TIGR02145 family)